jgi:hypothetical protein
MQNAAANSTVERLNSDSRRTNWVVGRLLSDDRYDRFGDSGPLHEPNSKHLSTNCEELRVAD